jgi:hypothetical protein
VNFAKLPELLESQPLALRWSARTHPIFLECIIRQPCHSFCDGSAQISSLRVTAPTLCLLGWAGIWDETPQCQSDDLADAV